MRIVLDTNVIVSALVFGGPPRRVFELIEDGYHEFFYSAPIQQETSRVLCTKFGWDQSALNRYLPPLWACGTKAFPRRKLRVVQEDPADDRILECAVSARASVIVTGSRPDPTWTIPFHRDHDASPISRGASARRAILGVVTLVLPSSLCPQCPLWLNPNYWLLLRQFA